MPDKEEPCDDSAKTNKNRVSFDEPPCCENEYQTVQVTNEFVIDTAQKTFNAEFAIAYIYTNLNIDLFPKSIHHLSTEYISPPLEKDIQVLFQTFLI